MGNEKLTNNEKTALLLGAAALVVSVLLIMVLALVFGKKSGGITVQSVARASFDMNYMPSESGYDIPINYPASIFEKVSEENRDGEINIHFASDRIIDITADVSIEPVIMNGRKYRLTKGSLGSVSGRTLVDNLVNFVRSEVEDQEGLEILEERNCDVTVDDPGKYLYSVTCKNAAGEVTSVAGWFSANSSGEYQVVKAAVKGNKRSRDVLIALRDRFSASNNFNVLLIPGGSPLTSKDTDDLLEITECHMGIPAPRDRFEKWQANETNLERFSDENAATIGVMLIEVEWTPENVANKRDDVIDLFKSEDTATGAQLMFSGTALTSRTQVSDMVYDREEWLCAYSQDFEDLIGGIRYWERNFNCYWVDATTNKRYWVNISLVAPLKNRSEYQNYIDKALSSLKDI